MTTYPVAQDKGLFLPSSSALNLWSPSTFHNLPSKPLRSLLPSLHLHSQYHHHISAVFTLCQESLSPLFSLHLLTMSWFSQVWGAFPILLPSPFLVRESLQEPYCMSPRAWLPKPCTPSVYWSFPTGPQHLCRQRPILHHFITSMENCTQCHHHVRKLFAKRIKQDKPNEVDITKKSGRRVTWLFVLFYYF